MSKCWSLCFLVEHTVERSLFYLNDITVMFIWPTSTKSDTYWFHYKSDKSWIQCHKIAQNIYLQYLCCSNCFYVILQIPFIKISWCNWQLFMVSLTAHFFSVAYENDWYFTMTVAPSFHVRIFWSSIILSCMHLDIRYCLSCGDKSVTGQESWCRWACLLNGCHSYTSILLRSVVVAYMTSYGHHPRFVTVIAAKSVSVKILLL